MGWKLAGFLVLALASSAVAQEQPWTAHLELDAGPFYVGDALSGRIVITNTAGQPVANSRPIDFVRHGLTLEIVGPTAARACGGMPGLEMDGASTRGLLLENEATVYVPFYYLKSDDVFALNEGGRYAVRARMQPRLHFTDSRVETPVVYTEWDTVQVAPPAEGFEIYKWVLREREYVAGVFRNRSVFDEGALDPYPVYRRAIATYFAYQIGGERLYDALVLGIVAEGYEKGIRDDARDGLNFAKEAGRALQFRQDVSDSEQRGWVPDLCRGMTPGAPPSLSVDW